MAVVNPPSLDTPPYPIEARTPHNPPHPKTPTVFTVLLFSCSFLVCLWLYCVVETCDKTSWNGMEWSNQCGFHPQSGISPAPSPLL